PDANIMEPIDPAPRTQDVPSWPDRLDINRWNDLRHAHAKTPASGHERRHRFNLSVSGSERPFGHGRNNEEFKLVPTARHGTHALLHWPEIRGRDEEPLVFGSHGVQSHRQRQNHVFNPRKGHAEGGVGIAANDDTPARPGHPHAIARYDRF